MDLKIAVISDLHCHSKVANKGVQESYLLTDVDLPSNQNPLLSFKQLIDEQRRLGRPLTADVLVMPGDLTNKCDEGGYQKGWETTKEIATLLGVSCIIPTVGNHDVDSRHNHSDDPFKAIREFAPDFPFKESSHNQGFWTEGFVFYEYADSRILVLNSAYDHTNVTEAEHGKISQETLNLLDTKLKSFTTKKRFNLAICHHHPIPHERHYLGTTDLIHNGTLLVEMLAEYDFQLIIHGHKHDPFVRYGSGGNTSPLIFSAGSFSAFKTLLLQGAYNTFHIITLEAEDKQDCENQGLIKTWFFTPSKGWDNDVNNDYILPNIGFGCRISLRALAGRILDWFTKQNLENCVWQIFSTQFPMINHLLPKDKKKLGELLTSHGINMYPKLPHDPEIISFKRKVA